MARLLNNPQLMRRSGMEPDAWQLQLLTSSTPQIALNCCRQSGKSTVVAFLALWTAVARPGSLILAIAPALRQAQELFSKIMRAHAQLENLPGIKNQSALRAEFINGSRIITLPDSERTIRSYSAVTLLLLDEASGILDQTYFTVRPMLAVARSQDSAAGRIILLSTPRGQRGFFYDAWTSGENWERISVSADQVDRITPEFLEEERKELGQHWYLQEYFCQFLAPQNAVFDYASIDSASIAGIPTLSDSPLFEVT